MNKKIISILFICFIFITISSCTNKQEVLEEQNTNQETSEYIDNSFVTDFSFTYMIPEGYIIRTSHNNASTMYFSKENDPDYDLGYITLSSSEKHDYSLDSIVDKYASSFKSDPNVLSHSNSLYTNPNDIECALFDLEFKDYYIKICYALTESSDVSVEATYYEKNSDIISGFNELIDSIK